MLHLTNGDCAASVLRHSGIAGEVVVWPDVLHDGPVPAEHGPVWRQVRAEYLSGGPADVEAMLREYEASDAALDRYREHDELVLWFEHDLFDQLLLARHLHWLGTHGHVQTRLSLVCIDRFPGVEPFHGLGDLTPSQLASLFPAREPVSRAQLCAGADVWRAFTASDPRALNILARDGVRELPFMAGALVRHLEEFPAVPDGLSRTERAVLETLTTGPVSPEDLFRAVGSREERVFRGDLSFWQSVSDMARGREPLVHVESERLRPGRLPLGRVSIAGAGTRVLAGDADAVRLRGIDKWLGGVHLKEGSPVWRWDSATRQVIGASTTHG